MRSILLPLTLLFCLFLGCEESTAPVYIQPLQPIIERIEPNFGSPGDIVNIYGQNLGDTSTLTIKVGNLPAQILQAKDDVITIRIPEGATEDLIRVERRTGSYSALLSEPFTLIKSPFLFNAFELTFTNVNDRFQETWSQDTQSAKTATGSESLYLTHSRVRTLSLGGELCGTITSGDTVRFCLHDRMNSGYAGTDAYEHNDERVELTVVIDSTRRLFRSVTYANNWSTHKQVAPLESNTSVNGRSLTLSDVPYTVRADGAFVGELNGNEIGTSLTGFAWTRSETRRLPESEYNSFKRILGLEYTDSSRVQLVLWRQPVI